MIAVLDIEADGLRETATQVHCVVVKSLETQLCYQFCNQQFDNLPTYSLNLLPQLFDKVTTVIGHNIIAYDLPMLYKFFGIDFSGIKIFDTYIVSQLLNPDRELPEGCPVSVPHPITGNKKLVGPHSLEALGWALGERKIHHYDWTTFSLEMLNRCVSDVLITEKVYEDFKRQLDVK